LYAQNALKGYSQVQVDAGVESASAHRLVVMLFDGLLERIAQAKGAIQQQDYENKGNKINDAISIVFGLRDSLDATNGGDLAKNLESLYDYVQRMLMQANLKNDEALLDECAQLIINVSSAWREIGRM